MLVAGGVTFGGLGVDVESQSPSLLCPASPSPTLIGQSRTG